MGFRGTLLDPVVWLILAIFENHLTARCHIWPVATAARETSAPIVCLATALNSTPWWLAGNYSFSFLIRGTPELWTVQRSNSGMYPTVMLIYHFEIYFLMVSMNRAHFMQLSGGYITWWRDSWKLAAVLSCFSMLNVLNKEKHVMLFKCGWL